MSSFYSDVSLETTTLSSSKQFCLFLFLQDVNEFTHKLLEWLEDSFKVRHSSNPAGSRSVKAGKDCNSSSILFSVATLCCQHSEARFKRRTLHVPNLMQMSENNRFFSFALDSAHVKFDVWNWPYSVLCRLICT